MVKNYRVLVVLCLLFGRCDNVPKVLNGTFTHETIAYGIVRFSEKGLLVQFSNPFRAQIKRIDFSIDGYSDEDLEVEWTCGLLKDFSIVRCSTDPRIFDSQEVFEFEKRGYYTAEFIFNKKIKVPNSTTVNIMIVKDNGVLKIPVELK
jgi:hypothetical protein